MKGKWLINIFRKDIWKIGLDGAPYESDTLLETVYTELGQNPCVLQKK